MDISQDVKCLKGVGPKLLEKLNKCGIFSILDLLLYFPRDYELFHLMKLMKKINRFYLVFVLE